LLIKIKKTELKQFNFESVANLNRTNSRNSFAKFYNSATKFLYNSELLTKLLDKNIINFYFIFACALFTNISIKNKKYKNIYK